MFVHQRNFSRRPFCGWPEHEGLLNDQNHRAALVIQPRSAMPSRSFSPRFFLADHRGIQNFGIQKFSRVAALLLDTRKQLYPDSKLNPGADAMVEAVAMTRRHMGFDPSVFNAAVTGPETHSSMGVHTQEAWMKCIVDIDCCRASCVEK